MNSEQSLLRNAEYCELLGLTSDGLPIIRLNGQDLAVELRGLQIVLPISGLYREIFEQRLMRIKHPLRCNLLRKLGPSKILGQLFYFGWQDKSGDVWLDIAQILLEEGLAKTVRTNFAERKEYLEYERRGSRPTSEH